MATVHACATVSPHFRRGTVTLFSFPCHIVAVPSSLYLQQTRMEGVCHVLDFVTQNLTQVLETYGYWAVLLFVMVERAGIPVPAETMLIAASIYAGTTPHMNIALVIAAAMTRAMFMWCVVP